MNSNLKKKIGHSSLSIDCSGLQLSTHSDRLRLENTWQSLRRDFNRGLSTFYDAPIDLKISGADQVLTLARKLKSRPGLRKCLFIGIGGSSLGPKSFFEIFPQQSAMDFIFVENPDPDDWHAKISKLSPEETLVCCATKSGKTFETLGLFLVALDWLGRNRWSNQVVCITDPENGELRKIARLENLHSLPIHEGIGGRFSIFSPVGLFPISLGGFDIGKFLSGAMKIREFFEKNPSGDNLIFRISEFLVSQFETFPMHVLMPYTSLLREFSQWWIQLWAESLGKNLKGFTPLSAVGAVDQHSLLQLLNEGPLDKLIFFIQNENPSNETKIPKIKWRESEKLETLSMLMNHRLKHLLDLEYNATRRVLENRGAPVLSLHLDKIEESSVGSLYFLFSVWTSFLGYLWEVNPFDQPGVEEGKNHVRAALKVDAPTHSL